MQTVNIGGFMFETYLLNTKFNDVPGIYVIYTSQKWLDVGETDKIGQRITSHERKDCWIANAGNLPINVAFHYESSQSQRVNIESSLRKTLNPTCGDK